MTMATRNPDIAFTRNPIRFTDSAPGETRQRSFSVTVGGEPVYTGHYASGSAIDVSEIAEAYVAPIPSAEGTVVDDVGVLLQLEDAEEFGKRLVTVTGSGDDPLTPPFFAIPGGVSPQNFRRLKELDTDIFAARLLDKRHNFFLTTRTHGWRIVLDEHELYPLVFVILHDEDCEIAVKAAGTDFSVPVGDILRGIYAIDIKAARMAIATEYGFLASVFEVVYDGFLACQIVIRHTDPEKDTTLVKFRNSLGAFELIHLSGQVESDVSPQENGLKGHTYDSVSGRYIGFRSRETLSRSIDVDTGFRTDEELRFILDMAASEEVYIRDCTGWVRVIPSIEDAKLRSPQLKPESLKVKLTMADEYDGYTPDIVGLKDFARTLIFSPEYSIQFN